jgi:hypothetical protein
MATSVIENILARVKAALLGATSAGGSVFRGRADAFADDELPGINVRRAASAKDSVGENGARILVAWDIEHHVAVTDNWETAADALHMAVHAVLAADAPLAALGRGLRCTGTDAEGDSADRVVGRLTARYQMQVFIRPGDLTKAIT